MVVIFFEEEVINQIDFVVSDGLEDIIVVVCADEKVARSPLGLID
jgi:hypothetical protein